MTEKLLLLFCILTMALHHIRSAFSHKPTFLLESNTSFVSAFIQYNYGYN
jgi:hypothetical protein